MPATAPTAESTVYPRVHGGTFLSPRVPDDAEGLSPRARGNPEAPLSGASPLGSIPACTGEPRGSEVGPVGARVYPRVHGGTEIS